MVRSPGVKGDLLHTKGAPGLMQALFCPKKQNNGKRTFDGDGGWERRGALLTQSLRANLMDRECAV